VLTLYCKASEMRAARVSQRLFISSRCAQTIFNQRLSLAEYAAAHGWETHFGGDASSRAYAQRLKDEGFEFHELPVNQRSLNPLHILWLIAAYFKTLRRLKPQVFHAFTIKPLICGLIGARLAGVPIRIATVPGLGHAFLSPAKWVRLVAALLFKIAFRFADVVIFYNQDDRDQLLRRKLVDPKKAWLIAGSGLNVSRFQVMPLTFDGVTKFVYVGRLIAEKGVPELLEAMRIARKKRANIELHLVGDCDTNNRSSLTRESIEQAVNEGLVTWHGLVPDVRPLIAAAHVVILPSHREGVPLALLEGAAMGRALIATNVPGCRDVVIRDETGLLVPVKDPLALADAILALATNPARIRKMGRAARKDIVARFDTNIVNARVVEIYEAAVKARGIANTATTSAP
jgi:glycosyltransferase involved in cell wall biosynthesis